ncbi:hypothetical protein PoB_004705700 [Plakobranchus ocellatus]|uniref:Ig-like domain-containing protein n=1 Tax=Plakobranchus ocellatus TaxID=259542 RepID=A0AAV4BNM7_9GAST|nr:hypothetical protein PoB_004705700 [Plakobranchus ocellatus]
MVGRVGLSAHSRLTTPKLCFTRYRWPRRQISVQASKMVFRVACLFAALSLICADQAEPDSTNALKIKAFSPGETNNPGDTLSVRCSIDRERTGWGSLMKLKLYSSETGEENSYRPLASIREDKVQFHMSKKEVFVDGKFHVDTDYRTKLQVTWIADDDGYCMYYKCVATGRFPDHNKPHRIFKVFQAGGADDSSCPSK